MTEKDDDIDPQSEIPDFYFKGMRKKDEDFLEFIKKNSTDIEDYKGWLISHKDNLICIIDGLKNPKVMNVEEITNKQELIQSHEITIEVLNEALQALKLQKLPKQQKV